ncbi:MAG: tetratricopeptide repeat protein [Bacteroidota bacterium]|nr:tetratricopeptide repeat protein [Bacteroidota bacterium]
MKSRFPIAAFLMTGAAFLLQGCAVWDFVDTRWQNATGYFNTYYNASKLYAEAEEEIAENLLSKVIDPQQSAAAKGIELFDGAADGATDDERGKIKREISMLESGTPSTAVMKLDKVIEKCSRILVNYPKSKWVDNALLLIGKSYYHKFEALRAERKFQELLDRYPESDLVAEAILWLGKTYVRLEKFDVAETMLNRAIEKAVDESEPDIAAAAYYELGKMFLLANNRPEAVKMYEQASDFSSDREQRIQIQLSLAREYERLEEKEKAAQAYRDIFKLEPDTKLAFIAELNYAKLKREVGDLDEASNTMINMLENPLYLDYDGKIQLEIGHLYYAYHQRYLTTGDTLAGDAFLAAMDQYTLVDTTFKSTEESADASYAKGRIYEEDVLDYDNAFEFYNKSKLSFPGAVSARIAAKKSKIFGEYRKLRNQMSQKDTTLFYVLNPDTLRVRDSLRVIADSLDRERRREEGVEDAEKSEVEIMAERFRRRRPHGRNTGRINPWLREMETQKAAMSMGLQATAQAIASSGPEYRRIDLRATDPDSLRAVLAELYMEMGWQMYDQIVNIDSARHYYQKALDNHLADSLRPQAVYTLAAIERRAGSETDAIALEDRLIRDYPHSRYAHGIMAQRGIPLPKDSTALAQEAYDLAARVLEQGNLAQGVEMMQDVIARYPASPQAVRAKLAIAMAYEEHRGDEALAMYREMVENHPTSPYSQRGKDILAAIENYEKDAVRRQQEAEARAEAERKAEEERLRKEQRFRNPLLDEELKVLRDSARTKEPKIDPSRDDDFPLRLPGEEPPADTTAAPAVPALPPRRPGDAPPTPALPGDTLRRLTPTPLIEKN